jgi:hypothetical protein
LIKLSSNKLDKSKKNQHPIWMDSTNIHRLIASALILGCGTVLVALGKISGESWGAMLIGLLLPSPLEKNKPKSLIGLKP